jgi:hypothetical protein
MHGAEQAGLNQYHHLKVSFDLLSCCAVTGNDKVQQAADQDQPIHYTADVNWWLDVDQRLENNSKQ